MLYCALDATNAGNVRLDVFSLAGDATNCSAAVNRTLLPGDSVKCALRKTVTPEQLAAAGPLQLSFPLTYAARGTVAALDAAPLESFSASLVTLIGASPACGACKACLASTRVFVSQHKAEPNVSALATAFGAYCSQDNMLKQTQRCAQTQADVASSTFGNLGRRAAGLCFALQLCDRKYGTSCATQLNVSTNAVAVSTATLDRCTGKLAAWSCEPDLMIPCQLGHALGGCYGVDLPNPASGSRAAATVQLHDVLSHQATRIALTASNCSVYLLQLRVWRLVRWCNLASASCLAASARPATPAHAQAPTCSATRPTRAGRAAAQMVQTPATGTASKRLAALATHA